MKSTGDPKPVLAAMILLGIAALLPGFADEPQLPKDANEPAATASSDDAAAETQTQPADAGRVPAPEFKRLNSVIGEWRGVGQPNRGSRQGAWTEKLTNEWSITPQASSVVLRSDRGQLFSEIQLRWLADREQLEATLIDGEDRTVLRGTIPDQWPGRIELLSGSDESETAERLTLQQLSEIRFVVLLERRTSPTGRFRRVAGVGYTRSGERLAAGATNQRTCIVTGGLGTMTVTHKGQTYYVCCSGCRQAFEADPDYYITQSKSADKAK